MAGKRKRKRQTEPKKKDSKQDINSERASFEDKKPKLDNEQNKWSDEPSQQLISGTKFEGENNNVYETSNSSPQTWEAEECKYIPPFTRKAKTIILKKDGSSVSPDVGTRQIKRPWRGRERKAGKTQQSPRSQNTNGEVSCMNDSPKQGKEEKDLEEEMQIDVIGMKGVVMSGQEKKDLPLASTSWTVTADLEGNNSLTLSGVLSSCSSCTMQGDISATVMQVIDDLCETIITHGNQCNDKTLEGQMAKAGSQTLLADGNEAVALTTVQEVQEHCRPAMTTTVVVGKETSATIHIHKDKICAVPVEPVASKHAIDECHESVEDSCVSTLQNFSLTLENELRIRQQGESDHKKCNYQGVVSSKSVNEHKLKHLGVNYSIVSRPEAQEEILFGQESSSGNEGIQAVITSVPLMDTQSISPQSLKDFVQLDVEIKQRHECGDGQSPKIDDVSTENRDSVIKQKVNMEKQMVEDKLSFGNHSDVCGAYDDLGQPTTEQGPDQMVPNDYENSTVISNEIPEATEYTRMSKMKEITVVFDKNIKHVTVVQTGATETGNGSNLESSQSLCTAQESELAKEETEDQTVTGTKPTCEIEHEELILETEREESHDMMQSRSIESPTRKLEGGFSSSGSDPDLLEFDSVMDCTDSQLVHADECFDEEQLSLRHLKHDPSNVYCEVGGDRTEGDLEVPSDRGMIKGLISELSTLNKFIIGAWKELESQRKKRQARLKLGKAKKFN